MEALLRLQTIETQLAALRRKRESKLRRIAVHQRSVEQADEKLHRQQKSVRERQTKLDAISLDVQAREESINKHREALNRTRTNKEYSAILTAMNTEKADNSKLESSILELMEEIQSLDNEANQVREERAKFVDICEAAEETLRAYDAETKPDMDRLTAAHEEQAENIPGATLGFFTRVAHHHDGEAMASVTQVHPKREEFACAGCNMTVSLEIVNTLRVQNKIQLCPSCGRILYLEAMRVKS